MTQHVKVGKLRALAVASGRRVLALPEVPTAAEAGAKGVEIEIWLGAFAPRGAPREIVTRLNSKIGRVLDLAEVRERIAPGGLGEVRGGTPEQFAHLVRSENAKWARVVRASGIKAE